MCVFSKLNPTNPAPIRPIIVARSIVTVPLVVGPVKTGPVAPLLEDALLELADELLVSAEEEPLPPVPPAVVVVETAPPHAPNSEPRPSVAANVLDLCFFMRNPQLEGGRHAISDVSPPRNIRE
jgi:hypothetical protein